MSLTFRDLYASEIDCRVQQIKNNGLSLLLYKDARCDMNILDETVGAMNWKREHTRNNANCIVSIWDKEKQQWISKEDTGTESNTEAEKGLASDSFKRACVNWGIGRELYTAPFIWIPKEKCNIETKTRNNKEYLVCNDKFVVSEIVIEDKKIKSVTIQNEKTEDVVYSWPNKIIFAEQPKPQEQQEQIYFCEDCGHVVQAIGEYSAKQVAATNKKRYGKIICGDCSKKLKMAGS